MKCKCYSTHYPYNSTYLAHCISSFFNTSLLTQKQINLKKISLFKKNCVAAITLKFKSFDNISSVQSSEGLEIGNRTKSGE